MIAKMKVPKGVYQFKIKSRHFARPEANKGYGKMAARDVEPPFTAVQGIMPTSVQEFRVAKALDKLNFTYKYQVPIGGGSMVRGGQILDFMINTAPLPTPCFVQGEYWHNRSSEGADLLKQVRVQSIYKGKVLPNLLLREQDLGSMAAAFDTVRKALIG